MGASSDINDENEISYENKMISYDLNEVLLCSKCGEIPEVLNVYTDNNKIEFNCRKCGIYEILIDEYFDRLSKSYYFKKCNSCKCKKNKYYYCFNCKNDYCEKCKERNHYNHKCIEVNEKKIICLKHNKEFKYFCSDCQENLCEEDIRTEHKNHKIMVISNLRQILINNEDIIKEINEELNNLIEFNNVILRNEEYFINSIKNIGKSLEEGNKRDSQDIKCLFTGLSRGIENSFKAIDMLKEYKIQLFRKDKYLHLNYRYLEDKGFKYISQIAFNQLKEIDISENDIKSVEPFNKMSLPFLEYLNLSFNRIHIIEPVSKLKSNNLEYIFLHCNKIKDIEAFLVSYFPALKILRVEDNNIGVEIEQDEWEKKKTKEILNKINKKYREKFIYKSIEEQIKEFSKKYRLGIYKEIKNIDLCDKKGGDEMLKYLFLIITYQTENKIKYLNLRNNDIKDPSMLSRINFNKLIKLDLGANKIEDLKFLQNMNSENLKELYLDNNLINDICPILNNALFQI